MKRVREVLNAAEKVSVLSLNDQEKLWNLALNPRESNYSLRDIIAPVIMPKEKHKYPMREFETMLGFLHDKGFADIVLAFLNNWNEFNSYRLLNQITEYSDHWDERVINWCLNHLSFQLLRKYTYSQYTRSRDNNTTCLQFLKFGINPLLFSRSHDNFLVQLFLNWDCKIHLGKRFEQGAIAWLLCMQRRQIIIPKGVRFYILRLFAIAEYYRMVAESKLGYAINYLNRHLDSLNSNVPRPRSIKKFYPMYLEEYSRLSLFRYPVLESQNKEPSRWQKIDIALSTSNTAALRDLYQLNCKPSISHIFSSLNEDDVTKIISNLGHKFDVPDLISKLLYQKKVKRALLILKVSSIKIRETFARDYSRQFPGILKTKQTLLPHFVHYGVMPICNFHDELMRSAILLSYWYNWKPSNHTYFTPEFRNSVFGWLLASKRLGISKDIKFYVIKTLATFSIDCWRHTQILPGAITVRDLKSRLVALNYSGKYPKRRNEILELCSRKMALRCSFKKN